MKFKLSLAVPRQHGSVSMRAAIALTTTMRTRRASIGLIITAGVLWGVAAHGFQLESSPLKPRKIIKPQYPAVFANPGISTTVTVTFGVDRRGGTMNPTIMNPTAAEFALAALEAVIQWEFETMIDGERPGGFGRYSFEFRAGENGAQNEVTMGHLVETPAAAPKKTHRMEPKIKGRLAPVYPDSIWDEIKEGEAEVRFLVNEAGNVTFSKVVAATHEDFGKAMVAFIEASKFVPAKVEGRMRPALMTLKHSFKPYGGRETQWQRLEQEAVKGGGPPGVTNTKQLERALKPQTTVAPTFPTTLLLEKIEGEALVQCFIGVDGVPGLLKVVSATREEFGYAAVQALSQWRFAPPRTKEGKTCVVSVQIPLEFKIDLLTKLSF